MDKVLHGLGATKSTENKTKIYFQVHCAMLAHLIFRTASGKYLTVRLGTIVMPIFLRKSTQKSEITYLSKVS